MDIKDLSRVDLNMLVALQALLEERNVSKAANRLFITQSAMSKTLGRLRELFDDQLFTRTASGMLPTPRAEQIALRLPIVLHGLQCIVQSPEFDPLTYEGEFSLILPEYIAAWLLPTLYKRLEETAPGMRFNILEREGHHLELLANGDLDFVVQIERHDYPEDFTVTSTGFAPPRLFVREGHPLAGKSPTWPEIEQYPQIEQHIPEREESEIAHSMANSSILKHYQETEAHLITEHIFVALQVVRSTDAVFLGPPLFAELNDLGSGLTTLPLPDEEDFMLKFVMVYHNRTAGSAAHQFLHKQLLDCIEEHRLANDLPCFEEMRKIHGLDY